MPVDMALHPRRCRYLGSAVVVLFVALSTPVFMNYVDSFAETSLSYELSFFKRHLQLMSRSIM